MDDISMINEDMIETGWIGSKDELVQCFKYGKI
jgi:hypothetical protein